MPPDSSLLPAPGQPVRVRAAGLAAICSVVAADAETVTLAEPVRGLDGPAELVFAHARGVVCLSGELAGSDVAGEFRITGSRLLDQRRETFRVGLEGRARLTRRDGSVEEVELRDLSAQGARVLSATAMKLGEALSIAVVLDDDELTVSGRVVRVDDRGYGIRFDALSRGDDDRLSHFLTEQQRHRVRIRD